MKKKVTIGAFIILIMVLGGYTLLDSIFSFSLKGKDKIETVYNTDYKEPGYEVKLGKKNISSKVQVKGTVNSKKLGSYTLKYKVKYLFLERNLTRTVTVVDKEPPVITLKGSNKMTIKINSTYKEPGYEVKDNVDNDLEVKIEGKVDPKKTGKYVLLYKVKDKSGNENSISREVIVEKSNNSSKGIPVLMYHYFYDEKKPPKGKTLNANYIEIKDLENQLKYLKENGFYFPSWQELYEYAQGKIDLPNKSVVLTSDDGAKSFFTYAVPLANKYQVPITSFFIASRKQEIEKYKSDYVHFESHTYDMHHAGCQGGRGGIFWCIDEKKGIADLKKAISIVGSDYALAYPYGDVNENIKNITKKAGVKMAFTIKNGRVKPGMDLLELPRVRISKGTSLESFKKMVG